MEPAAWEVTMGGTSRAPGWGPLPTRNHTAPADQGLRRLRPPSPRHTDRPPENKAWIVVATTVLLLPAVVGLASHFGALATTRPRGTSETAATPTTAAPLPPVPVNVTAPPAIPGTPTPAQQGNAALDSAARHVRDVAVSAFAALAPALSDPTSTNLSGLALASQAAYGDLNQVKGRDADVFSNSGDAGYEMSGALNDLKNAIGTLTAYAADPTTTAFARFTSQWQAAVGRWNDGVTKVYAGAQSTPPTIPSG